MGGQKRVKIRVLFPIGAKLVIIITFLLLASLGSVILLVSALSTQDAQRNAEQNNFTINIRAGSQAASSFNSIQAAVLLYLETLERFPALEQDPDIRSFFFDHNENIAAIWTAGAGNVNPSFIHNPQFLDTHNIDIAQVQAYFASPHTAFPDTMRLFNSSPVFQTSMLTAVFMQMGAAGDRVVKALFAPADLFDSFSTGANTSFLINSYGSLLLHPDIFLVVGDANFSSLPIVTIMEREGDHNRQVSYEYLGYWYFGAYYRLAGTDTAVITVIPHDIVFEAVRSFTRQNLFLAAAVLFITISLVWIFSKTISRPARILASAALRIEEGDFNVNLTPQSRDELGLLTESFDKMSSALNIFGRFTNKDIAIRAMRGEIKPGGLPKYATIFFSDIRKFTEKTETFSKVFGEEASNRVILWLNEYFSGMIDCVEKTGGVVDKFIGDALMAHWGTAFTAGSPAEDAYSCVKAALMMRAALIEFNERRPNNEPGNPMINIGCGINSGAVIAGQIGSEYRMEYTAIGDPVNLANRVESLNKCFGTDILITENTWELTGNRFITEEMPSVTVKGKEEPVRVFAVVNFIDAEDGPKTLAEVQKLLSLDVSVPDPDPALEYDYTSHAAASAVETAQTYDLSADDDIVIYRPQNKVQEYRQKSVFLSEAQSAANTQPAAASGDPNAPVIKMTSFGSSALVQGPAGERVPVFFAWNISNLGQGNVGGSKNTGRLSPLDVNVIVEVAADPNFNVILEDREVFGTLSISIPLDAGRYWWRVYPARQAADQAALPQYPCGTLRVETDAKERIKVHQN